jgi:hypothetical protein
VDAAEKETAARLEELKTKFKALGAWA